MWSNDKHFPPRSTTRGFLTPQPPAWKKSHSTVLPLSERKRTSPADKNDFFHVMHKVPACDSPYGRAKHVQLIDKDPSKAISLFWAAINAGDRVDSALKDMAVVMRQLDRSDEAIEAIKSFRHLCTYDSQESLDNVLVELYKRSGRIEEEIEMLQNRLKNIEEGTVFGGKRTKIVKSQGKKILITIEQEKARILGNLAWAYLQQHNYGIAEQHYRKALALEPDTNKECNLAICLMRMKRISEAKSLLQHVKASLGNEEMDKSFSKSYERAFEILIQVEPQSMVEPVTQEQTDKGRESRTSLKEASIFLPRNEDNMPGLMDKIQPCVHWDGKMLADEQNHNCFEYDDRSSKYTPIGSKCDLQSSSQTMSTEKWGKGSYSENSYEGSAHKRICSATFRKNSEVLYTQPRWYSWESNNSDQHKRERWGGEDTVRNPIRRLSFEQVKDEFQDDLSEVLLTQPWVLNLPSKHNLNEEPLVSCKYESNTEVERPKNTVNKKSWADMAEEEEEEEEELSGSKCLNKEKEFNDENMNSNIINQHPPDSKNHHIRSITQRLESLDMNMKAGACNAPPYIVSRRNRLQVFHEITSP